MSEALNINQQLDNNQPNDSLNKPSYFADKAFFRLSEGRYIEPDENSVINLNTRFPEYSIEKAQEILFESLKAAKAISYNGEVFEAKNRNDLLKNVVEIQEIKEVRQGELDPRIQENETAIKSHLKTYLEQWQTMDEDQQLEIWHYNRNRTSRNRDVPAPLKIIGVMSGRRPTQNESKLFQNTISSEEYEWVAGAYLLMLKETEENK